MLRELPTDLLTSLQNAPDFNRQAFDDVHRNGKLEISVRFNYSKVGDQPIDLSDDPTLQVEQPVPWASNSYYLKSRPSFTTDPRFHAGAYYVQEASSMFLEQVMKQTVDISADLKVLDLCAAPGGKSTLIANLITPDSLLVCNEIIKTRVAVLAENLTKWGASNVTVTNNDPADFKSLKGFFDVIVIDAPCSGSGLFRKDPDAVSHWSLKNVDVCSRRQQRILEDILPCLKKEGILIYSTCSYSFEEDEAISDWILENAGYQFRTCKINTSEDWHIVETVSPKASAFGYRFYPDRLKGEGFFIAAFRKESGQIVSTDNTRKSKTNLPSAKEVSILNSFMISPGNYSFLKLNTEVLAFPSVQFENLLILQNCLYLKKAGVKLGTLIRDELIPDHELVMSNLLLQKWPVVNVNNDSALDYLRRKDITIDTPVRGWCVIAYSGFALGFAKILTARINNYYPRGWRIINK